VPYKSLNKTQITNALRRLGELAVANGTVLEVSLYGGAVFTVLYGTRDSTKDVDAIVNPSDLARELSAKVASELDLPADWLNDDVRFFLADKEAKRKLEGGEFGDGLNVSVPTAAYLLAMKLRASRPPQPGHPGDYADIEFLLKKMELSSLADAERVYENFFPHNALSDSARDAVRLAILNREKP
jgi:hypothetical protein